ncbi:tetratricopeptide repeat protein [Rhodohalobacter sp. 8-1]|uniref:tetratricopeptide repeat protein n=1 Tax=Rhodohalobacter sp. 8-1 TaxID=3131972 RepID=UPI0030EE3445
MRIFILILLTAVLSASSLNDARKANDAFRSGDYEMAVELYRKAIDENPDDARLHYNLGSALAKLGESEASVQSFQMAKQLMTDPEEKARADYNAGTALSEAEMYDEALDFYRSALKNNPGDPDAKHNYEMSVKKQQEQEQQQQQDSSDNQDENEEEQEQDQNQQDQQQNQDQDQDQQDNESEGSPQDQEAGEQNLPQPDEISREEAENILNALEQLERQLLENRKKEAEDPGSTNDKDW